jgi:hypothetical protein
MGFFAEIFRARIDYRGRLREAARSGVRVCAYAVSRERAVIAVARSEDLSL